MRPASIIQARTTPEVADALGVDSSPSLLVHIDDAQLVHVAESISTRAASSRLTRATWDNPLFWNAEAAVRDRAQFFAIGNAINFRFWRLEKGRVVPSSGRIDEQHFQGAMYMWRCLRRCLDRGTVPLLDARFLAEFTDSDLDAIFTDDDGVNRLEVARAERVANLRDLGAKLLQHWDGAFYNLAVASGGSVVTFARLSSDLRAFDDPLYKLTMVNAIVHSGSGVYDFLDDLLPAIDYHLLRHALRQGLIVPRRDLATRLKNRELLTAEEAYELRRVTLQAFVRLTELSGQSGEVIDNNYWLNRSNCTDDPVCLNPELAPRCPFLDVCSQMTDYPLPLELTRYY